MDEQYIIDCITRMLQQEERYLCHDYLDEESSQASSAAAAAAAAAASLHQQQKAPTNMIDETCRSKMCEWIYHVIDSTRLQRETASVAMNFLDRFLCSSSPRAVGARSDRKEYQLAAMTCLYIAVKINEPFEMDATLMSRLSRGLHTAQEITTLEYEILIALQWIVNGPTPVQFINYILELLPSSAKSISATLYENSHFQSELAVGDYAFVPNLRQSTVAVAAILNSLGSVYKQEEDASPFGSSTSCTPFNECMQFIRDISSAFNLDIDSPLMNAVRARLLESFARTSGYELCQQDFLAVAKQQEEELVNLPNSQGQSITKSLEEEYTESPACVSKEMAISLEEQMMM